MASLLYERLVVYIAILYLDRLHGDFLRFRRHALG